MDSTDYLDTPYTASAVPSARIERDLITALDERDALIAHYQQREAERQARASSRALGIVLVALAIAVTLLALLVVAVWKPEGFWIAAIAAAAFWGVTWGEARGKGWGE